jgi:DNA (cytosine-5)-methyltransferase 1
MYSYYEFFAGGGMVRAGLGSHWQCLFANDFDLKKGRIYRQNWGDTGELKSASVELLRTADLPGTANLVWASFPCQDLSLAGAGAGLKGERSGTFWPFWNLVTDLVEEGRVPPLIVLENVCGALTSHGGKDFATICKAMLDAGYSVGALVMNALLFVPQSRPRLFVIGVRKETSVPSSLVASGPLPGWHSKALINACSKLPSTSQERWIWWNLPEPSNPRMTLSDIIEENPADVKWFSEGEVERLIGMMSDLNMAKLDKAKRAGIRIVGGVYRRTRPDTHGRKVQRAEIRFDNVSGCLRTPAGGSSRQVILIVEGKSVKARLISTRETARLMGLPDSYELPENYNEAYHLTGDGVVVPVVRYLAAHIFEPILACLTEHKSILAA